MRHHKLDSFNLRVYGVWVNPQNELLLCEEKIGNQLYVKFPGGGLEFGEGVIDCIKREWREEIGQDLEQLVHYYTTEFFQPSAFSPRQQVISIYYRVWPVAGQPMRDLKSDPVLQRYILQALDQPFSVDLPIDKVVAQRVQADFRAGKLS